MPNGMKDDDEILAPVPDGVSVDPPGSQEDDAEAPLPDGVAAAGYDEETDLAAPVHRAGAETTPFGEGQLIGTDPGAAYDVERDTAP